MSESNDLQNSKKLTNEEIETLQDLIRYEIGHWRVADYEGTAESIATLEALKNKLYRLMEP